jgi:hypothetical protein
MIDAIENLIIVRPKHSVGKVGWDPNQKVGGGGVVWSVFLRAIFASKNPKITKN